MADLNSYTTELNIAPAEKAARKLAEFEKVKKRAYIRWYKIYENKEKQSTIYQIHFKRFFYKSYNRSKLSLLVSKQSIAFQYSQIEKNTKKITNHKYLICFKNSKLAFYSISSKKIRRFSPLFQKDLTHRVFKDSNDIVNAECFKNYQIRLCKLFIKKCRENKVTFCRNHKEIDNLGELIKQSYYPVYNELQLFNKSVFKWQKNAGADYICNFLKKDNYKKFIKSMTGYNSKMVTRLALESYKNDNTIIWANKLLYCNIVKKLVPLDFLHQILSSSNHNALNSDIFGSIVCNNREPNFVKFKIFVINFLKHYSPQQIIKFMDSNFHIFVDTINIYNRLIENNPNLIFIRSNNLNEIHDDLAAQERKIKNPDRPIKNDKKLLKFELDGEKVADMIIRVPQTLHQLQDWGAQMKNCIGGYNWQIENNESWILGVERDNKIIYGIEIKISNKEIAQFRGKYNADPEDNDRKLINEFLENKKVIKFIYPTIEQQVYEPIDVRELVAAGSILI